MLTTQTGVVQGSFTYLWLTILQSVPNILWAIIIFIIGWLLGLILYKVVIEVVKVLRLNEALKAAGVHEAAKDAGFHLDIGRFLGTLVMWFIVLVFLDASLAILGLTQVTIFLEQVVLLYLPQVIIASLILILGALVADVVRKVVTTSAYAAGSRSAHFTGAVAKWAIWIFAILAALDQLGIAAAFIQTIFAGIVIAAAIAFGLAFGLGGKDAASRAIEHIRSEIAHPED